MQLLLLPLPYFICSRVVLPAMPQEEEIYLPCFYHPFTFSPPLLCYVASLFSSTASSPAFLVFRLLDARMQLPSLLLPYRIYHRGELYFLATR
jgi:hypothetical protein